MMHTIQIGKGFRNLAAFRRRRSPASRFRGLGRREDVDGGTTADSATDTGSIRYIVSKAGKGDTIKFTSGGATLTGALAIDKKLTIEGPATIRQTGGKPHLPHSAGGNVTLKNNGRSPGVGENMGEGGAIHNSGS